MKKLTFKETCFSLKGKSKLLLLLIFTLTRLPVFSQGWSSQFQKTADNKGYYRNCGNIGFVNPAVFWELNAKRYLDKTIYSSGEYPSIIKGNIWTVINIIDVPESLKKTMRDTLIKETSQEPCFLGEFIFPYEQGIGAHKRKGFLVVVTYGQETWGVLDCASAFFVALE